MNSDFAMKLKVTSASGYRDEELVVRIVAEGSNGTFCLCPRHQELATVLVPGLVEFTTAAGDISYLAIDEGVLIKANRDVSICTRHAARGDDLNSLQRIVDEQFAELDVREQAARAAVARLEADFARRFLTLQERGHV